MTKATKYLLEGYREYLDHLKPNDDVAKIHVDEIAAKFAAFYERIRGFIDYKEEHLLRKGFIDRVFRRRFFFKDFSGNMAEPLIKEIIRSGRLPNDSVPETKIAEVNALIDGLVAILKDLKKVGGKKTDQLSEWLIDLTVNSIEECLFPPLKENLMADTMFWALKEKVTVSGAELSEKDLNIQLFLGIQRALLRADDDQLHYRLLKFVYPNWNALQNGDRMQFVSNLANVKKAIEGYLNHPLNKYFFKLSNRYNTIFLLIGDIIDQKNDAAEFENIFSDPDELEKSVKKVYKKRYEKERSRLNRLAFLSVLSIFLSKILVALGVEVPIDLYLTHEYNPVNTVINVIFPALLMLIIVLSIKMPSEENEELVVDVTKNICYGEEKKGFGINVPKKKGLFTRIIIQTLYLSLFLFVFYFLYMRLKEFGFSAANIAVFTFFTSLVAATGVKVHNRAKDISLEERNPKVLGFLIDIFALPFITVGKWGLATLNRLNILVVVFNLIIELPFQIFIQFVENFRSFIKSKKEELS